MWADLQQVFYIVLGQYIAELLLPLFVAAGLILAIVMSFSRFWRPEQRVRAIIKRDE